MGEQRPNFFDAVIDILSVLANWVDGIGESCLDGYMEIRFGRCLIGRSKRFNPYKTVTILAICPSLVPSIGKQRGPCRQN